MEAFFAFALTALKIYLIWCVLAATATATILSAIILIARKRSRRAREFWR
jgi:hypothetical protein